MQCQFCDVRHRLFQLLKVLLGGPDILKECGCERDDGIIAIPIVLLMGTMGVHE
jgi:hypothetical protein